jgi:hypothetical protein
MEDQFLNIVRSHESNQPKYKSNNYNSSKIIEELNQSNDDSDTKRTEKIWKQSDACSVTVLQT